MGYTRFKQNFSPGPAALPQALIVQPLIMHLLHISISPDLSGLWTTASVIKIHHTFDFDFRKEIVEKSSRQR
jgi:hypothetical protein